MSIATPPTFLQVHLALQSIHPHTADLSPVCVGACSRNSVYDVDRRKTYCSTSRQSVSALAGLLTGEIIRCPAGPATLSTSTTGEPSAGWQRWRKSFGVGVPEKLRGLSLQSIHALRPLSLFRSLGFALE